MTKFLPMMLTKTITHLLVGLFVCKNVIKMKERLDFDKKKHWEFPFANNVIYGGEINRSWSHRPLVLGDNLFLGQYRMLYRITKKI